jgi:predicted DNA-binding protein (MmcQ/YjbR family)
MELTTLKKYLLNKLGANEDTPFGPETLVIKVGSKIFALISLDEKHLRINLKCDPDDAQILRSLFPAIIPGYHMNKEHWNTLILDGSIPSTEIERLIDHSYDLVFRSLSKKMKNSVQDS